jgi:hypothetical protein
MQAFCSAGNVTPLGSAALFEDAVEITFQGHRKIMTDDDADGGIFGGDFGFDSDAEKEKEEEREKRTVQTEEDFQRQKREWTPKVETREVFCFGGRSSVWLMVRNY